MQSLSLSFCVCACALSGSNNTCNVQKHTTRTTLMHVGWVKFFDIYMLHKHMTHMTDFGHLHIAIMSEINAMLLCMHACIIILYRLTYIIIHTYGHTCNQINSSPQSPSDTLWLRNLLPMSLQPNSLRLYLRGSKVELSYNLSTKVEACLVYS